MLLQVDFASRKCLQLRAGLLILQLAVASIGSGCCLLRPDLVVLFLQLCVLGQAPQTKREDSAKETSREESTEQPREESQAAGQSQRGQSAGQTGARTETRDVGRPQQEQSAEFAPQQEGARAQAANTGSGEGAQAEEAEAQKSEGAQTSRAEGAQTSRAEGAQTSRAEGAQTSRAEGAQTSRAEGAQTSRAEGAQTSRAEGAQTSRAEGAQTSRAEGAQTSRAEGAQTSRAEGAQTSRAEGAQTSRAEGAQTSRAEGAQTSRAEGAQTSRAGAGTERAAPDAAQARQSGESQGSRQTGGAREASGAQQTPGSKVADGAERGARSAESGTGAGGASRTSSSEIRGTTGAEGASGQTSRVSEDRGGVAQQQTWKGAHDQAAPNEGLENQAASGEEAEGHSLKSDTSNTAAGQKSGTGQSSSSETGTGQRAEGAQGQRAEGAQGQRAEGAQGQRGQQAEAAPRNERAAAANARTPQASETQGAKQAASTAPQRETATAQQPASSRGTEIADRGGRGDGTVGASKGATTETRSATGAEALSGQGRVAEDRGGLARQQTWSGAHDQAAPSETPGMQANATGREAEGSEALAGQEAGGAESETHSASSADNGRTRGAAGDTTERTDATSKRAGAGADTASDATSTRAQTPRTDADQRRTATVEGRTQDSARQSETLPMRNLVPPPQADSARKTNDARTETQTPKVLPNEGSSAKQAPTHSSDVDAGNGAANAAATAASRASTSGRPTEGEQGTQVPAVSARNGSESQAIDDREPAPQGTEAQGEGQRASEGAEIAANASRRSTDARAGSGAERSEAEGVTPRDLTEPQPGRRSGADDANEGMRDAAAKEIQGAETAAASSAVTATTKGTETGRRIDESVAKPTEPSAETAGGSAQGAGGSSRASGPQAPRGVDPGTAVLQDKAEASAVKRGMDAATASVATHEVDPTGRRSEASETPSHTPETNDGRDAAGAKQSPGVVSDRDTADTARAKVGTGDETMAGSATAQDSAGSERTAETSTRSSAGDASTRSTADSTTHASNRDIATARTSAERSATQGSEASLATKPQDTDPAAVAARRADVATETRAAEAARITANTPSAEPKPAAGDTPTPAGAAKGPEPLAGGAQRTVVTEAEEDNEISAALDSLGASESPRALRAQDTDAVRSLSGPARDEGVTATRRADAASDSRSDTSSDAAFSTSSREATAEAEAIEAVRRANGRDATSRTTAEVEPQDQRIADLSNQQPNDAVTAAATSRSTDAANEARSAEAARVTANAPSIEPKPAGGEAPSAAGAAKGPEPLAGGSQRLVVPEEGSEIDTAVGTLGASEASRALRAQDTDVPSVSSSARDEGVTAAGRTDATTTSGSREATAEAETTRGVEEIRTAASAQTQEDATATAAHGGDEAIAGGDGVSTHAQANRTEAEAFTAGTATTTASAPTNAADALVQDDAVSAGQRSSDAAATELDDEVPEEADAAARTNAQQSEARETAQRTATPRSPAPDAAARTDGASAASANQVQSIASAGNSEATQAVAQQDQAVSATATRAQAQSLAQPTGVQFNASVQAAASVEPTGLQATAAVGAAATAEPKGQAPAAGTEAAESTAQPTAAATAIGTARAQQTDEEGLQVHDAGSQDQHDASAFASLAEYASANNQRGREASLSTALTVDGETFQVLSAEPLSIRRADLLDPADRAASRALTGDTSNAASAESDSAGGVGEAAGAGQGAVSQYASGGDFGGWGTIRSSNSSAPINVQPTSEVMRNDKFAAVAGVTRDEGSSGSQAGAQPGDTAMDVEALMKLAGITEDDELLTPQEEQFLQGQVARDTFLKTAKVQEEQEEIDTEMDRTDPDIALEELFAEAGLVLPGGRRGVGRTTNAQDVSQDETAEPEALQEGQSLFEQEDVGSLGQSFAGRAVAAGETPFAERLQRNSFAPKVEANPQQAISQGNADKIMTALVNQPLLAMVWADMMRMQSARDEELADPNAVDENGQPLINTPDKARRKRQSTLKGKDVDAFWKDLWELLQDPDHTDPWFRAAMLATALQAPQQALGMFKNQGNEQAVRIFQIGAEAPLEPTWHKLTQDGSLPKALLNNLRERRESAVAGVGNMQGNVQTWLDAAERVYVRLQRESGAHKPGSPPPGAATRTVRAMEAVSGRQAFTLDLSQPLQRQTLWRQLERTNEPHHEPIIATTYPEAQEGFMPEHPYAVLGTHEDGDQLSVALCNPSGIDGFGMECTVFVVDFDMFLRNMQGLGTLVQPTAVPLQESADEEAPAAASHMSVPDLNR